MEQAANGPPAKKHSGARARLVLQNVRIPASRPQRAGQHLPAQRISESAWCGKGPAVAVAAAMAAAATRVGPFSVRYCHSCMPRDQVHLACARRPGTRHVRRHNRMNGRAWGPTLRSLAEKLRRREEGFGCTSWHAGFSFCTNVGRVQQLHRWRQLDARGGTGRCGCRRVCS